MAGRPMESELATTDEVRAALLGLTSADLARIKQIAVLRAKGLPDMDWRDLVSESVSRALAGTRRWPRSVAFIAFLAQTMRSVASEEWRRFQQEPVRLQSEPVESLARGSEGDPQVEGINSLHPEREIVARRTLGEIEALFRDDADAMVVLNGLAQGFSAEETQVAAGMTPKRYATTQKRIRRRLASHFLKET